MKRPRKIAKKLLLKKRRKDTGLPPGTLVHVGEKRTETVRLTLFRYNAESMLEERLQIVEEALTPHDPNFITWLNIDGLHDTTVVEKVGNFLSLHPLIQEDILNTSQRPKCEDYEHYIYIVLKMLTLDPESGAIHTEQVSMVLGSDYVISFQEMPGDVFELIRERIRSNKGRIRKNCADYLVYALIDAVVDHYFVILDKIGERLEALEDELDAHPDTQTLHRIHLLKRELITLRRSVWPLREVVNMLIKTESELVHDVTTPYLRDVYDHTIQVIDTIESYRDSIAGMTDLYMSSISSHMNSIMKVLTIISTLFIPLTFISGIYGMNFDFMPEIHWKYGYVLFWGIITTTVSIMLYMFRKNKWL